jgi:hypothetical protein
VTAGQGDRLLEDLAAVRWAVASRTYGSDHATLIGLLVDWWVSSQPNERWALESGPSFGYVKGGKGRGQCDALLCEGTGAVGLVEVEAYRRVYTVRKVGKFFASRDPDLRELQFAILLLYAGSPVGRGAQRIFPSAADDSTLEALGHVSESFPGKPVILVTVDKVFERSITGIRARNDYYRGAPSAIKGVLYLGGKRAGERTYSQRVV